MPSFSVSSLLLLRTLLALICLESCWACFGVSNTWHQFTGRCRGLGFSERGPLLCGTNGVAQSSRICKMADSTGGLLNTSNVYSSAGIIEHSCMQKACEDNSDVCGGYTMSAGIAYPVASTAGPPAQCGIGRRTTQATCPTPDCLWKNGICSASPVQYPSGFCSDCSCHLPEGTPAEGVCSGAGSVLVGGHCMCPTGGVCLEDGSCSGGATTKREAVILREQQQQQQQSISGKTLLPGTVLTAQRRSRTRGKTVVKRGWEVKTTWCASDDVCRVFGDKGAVCHPLRRVCLCSGGGGGVANPLCQMANNAEGSVAKGLTAELQVAYTSKNVLCTAAVAERWEAVVKALSAHSGFGKVGSSVEVTLHGADSGAFCEQATRGVVSIAYSGPRVAELPIHLAEAVVKEKVLGLSVHVSFRLG